MSKAQATTKQTAADTSVVEGAKAPETSAPAASPVHGGVEAPKTAPPAPAPVAIVKKVEPRKLPPRSLAQAEFARNVWSIVPEQGTTLQEILTPEYFAHVGIKFKPRDKIEVCFNDMSYYAELLVIDTDRLWTKTAVIFAVDLAGEKAAAAAAREQLNQTEYIPRYTNITDKWTVIRLSDNQTVSSFHGTKQDADKWIVEHMKAMAR